MSYQTFLPYVFVMALVTYLTRMVPLVAFRKKIRNRFIRSFLCYIPYAVLAAMTLPGILYSTGSMPTALCGLIVAAVLSLLNQKLLTVAIGAAAAVYIAQFFL